MRGIYKITNKINNKVYIGESLNILRRWDEHIDDLNRNKHHSYKLQKDWNEYGQDNFEFNIVSVLDESISNFIDQYILLIYEYKYINKYDSLNNGYNIENTLNEIFLENKKVTKDSNVDIALIKKYGKKIESNIIVDKGGIIFINCYSIKQLKEKIGINNKKLKQYMINNNILIKIKNKYTINSEYNNYFLLFENDSFSNIGITKEGLDFINNNINYINNTTIKTNINKNNKKENTNKITIYNTDGLIKKEVILKSIDKDKLTMKEFITSFNTSISYNNIFKWLRENNIFKYVYIQDKANNYPTDEYINLFELEKIISDSGKEYYRIFINKTGKKELYKILYTNNIILNYVEELLN